MNSKEMSSQRSQSETEKQFNSFESAAEQLKTEFQNMFENIPLYKEMKENRLEFALSDNEDFMKKIYPEGYDEFCQDIRKSMIDFRLTLDQVHNDDGFSYQSIFEAIKKTDKRVLYVSPRFVIDEATGDKVHIGMFIADDNQCVITYHTEPTEEIKDEANRIITKGLL